MKIEKAEIRLAMLGMIEGNGHPYSWSAIVNGYNPEEMAKCPFPVIPQYLSEVPLNTMRILGARVTHVWTDDPADAPKVAAASRIQHVVARPEDVIGQVDAVIIGTDDGHEHVRRARPFIEAGLPLFVDKPLAVNVADLNQFIRWHQAGKVFLSSSNMRYAPEIRQILRQKAQLGELRWITLCTSKTWERYAIHALEAIWPVLGPGFLGVRTESRSGSDIAYLTHRSGAQVSLAVIYDAVGSYGALHVFGTKGNLAVNCWDTYTAFRNQLCAFVEMLRAGERPYPLSETIELMAVIIAGLRSRERGGACIELKEVFAELEPPFGTR
ncbi:MAG TPA: Gfo/Idh/MocA family oxidoreductase [Verrucomicrobiota bacterium]|nr:Gfo/Idh/MocA family oxidoreductase [Verrucomicrobiota bacterium]HQL76968.1 Gfo/Idh/MocA family oxidoreductase [Verrucomicrobiota bacterium]